jgi:hypothetical protein
LPADFVRNVRQSEILEVLAALHRRSLIEKSADGFTQLPLVREYIKEKQIEQVCKEIDPHRRSDSKYLN